AMAVLNDHVRAAADELCTAFYFSHSLARRFKELKTLAADNLEPSINLMPSNNLQPAIRIDTDAPSTTDIRMNADKSVVTPTTPLIGKPESRETAKPTEESTARPLGAGPTSSNKFDGSALVSNRLADEIVNKLGAATPDATAKLGIRFLEGALMD